MQSDILCHAPTAPVVSHPRRPIAILSKSLAKERDDRYTTVDALCADLRRSLAGEPVLARSPSTWGQLRRLARRLR